MGGRPGEEAKIKPGSITLQRAWERYRDDHMIRKGRDARTIENYRDHMERLFADWLDKPLVRLGRQPNLVADRHNKISKENGRYIANGAMRSLRAVYNHARKTNLDLPPVNPVTAIDWNVEERRNTGMGTSHMAPWFAELAALTNPIRREFHLMTLLSGSRPTALKNVRLAVHGATGGRQTPWEVSALTEPFAYVDYGNLATVGRKAAVADFRGFRLTGFIGWLLWCAAHIYYLIGFKNRIAVALDWTWSYLTFDRGARLITGDIDDEPRTQTAKRDAA